MKNILSLLLFIIIFASPVFSAEVVTSLIYDFDMTTQLPADSYMNGDIWLKFKDDINADFDFQFNKDQTKINVAQIKLAIPATDIMIGRQQIGWGVGYSFNPIDIINPTPIGASFDPSFVKDGRDAVVISRYIDNTSKLEAVYASPFEAFDKYDASTTVRRDINSDAGLKYKTNLYEYDVSLIYLSKGQRSYSGLIQPSDKVYGLEIAGTLPMIDWGIWNELAYYGDQNIYEFLVGSDYYFGNYHAVIEYYYNGFGDKSKLNYDPSFLIMGRAMAQDYIVPSFSWAASEKLNLTEFAFINLNDGSFISGGVVDYFINNNVELILMPFLMMGSNLSEYGMQQAIIGRYGIQAKVKWVF